MPTYTTLSSLGAGGFGAVYRVARNADGLPFAMKVLTDKDNESKARFQKEVRCIEKLSHPNVVTIVDKSLTSEPYFYIMPLASHSLVNEIPAILGDMSRIRKIFQAVFSAVQFAHSEGVLHRDLKPDNVLVMPDDSIIVADFGLGRIITSASTRLTVSGQGIGTPFYCAPEQAADTKAADARADIFSLGQMLHDCFVGFSPVHDFDSMPFPIANIIRRSTRHDPGKRFQTVQAMAEAFEQAMGALIGDFETDSIETLIVQVDEDTAEEAKLSSLAKALAIAVTNGDVVQKALMQMSAESFCRLEKLDVALARALASQFETVVTAQSWGFSFTDEIGIKSRGIFRCSTDIEVRLAMLKAVLLVGTSHNRWDVMRIFASMLETVTSNIEAAAIAEALGDSKGALNHVRDYISTAKLTPLLQKLMHDSEL